ncbi:MAG: sensor domain-containing diguanylate cyclase [Lachnospiraceae bacterium]|nr:sensor domain-containing diguanylate cyclase [Lachnospiraceae bacterium]
MKKVRSFIKDNVLLITNICIIVFGALFALGMSYTVIHSIVKEDMESTTCALFDGIYGSISNQLEYSANFTKAMCNDYLLQNMLEKEDDMPEEEFEEKMAQYLEKIRAVNKWEGTYLISCTTNKYYTPRGVGKVVDPSKDSYDVWYENFVKSGMEYGADLTYDQFNEKAYVVFTDRRMEVNGKLRAVLGCAVYLSDITNEIKRCSEKYNVDVCLTDIDGNTTLDDEDINLGEAYYSRYYNEDMKRENQVYTKDGFIIRKFIPELGMYLVVKNDQYMLSQRFFRVFLGIAVYALVMILLLTCLNFHKFKGEKAVLKNKVRTDFLTKVSNVNGLYTSINLFLEGEKSRQIGASMFLFDMDNFKEINDTFGHGKGDEVLVKFARELTKHFRAGDIVGRLGGDEFVVFSPGLIDPLLIERKAKELTEFFTWKIEDGGEAVDISVSIGIAVYPNDAQTYKELYKMADQSLYYVKEHGKRGYCIYSNQDEQ